MRTLLVGLLMLALLKGSAQKGTTFPAINGSDLNDKSMSLPQKNGKYSIVAIAYHRGAEDDLKKWLNPLFDNFANKNKGSSDFDMTEAYDVNFIFVPMISGFKKIKEEFKSGTDKGFWPYVMDTEKTDIKGVQKQLGVEDNKIPYVYVLDKDGKIVEVQSGKFSQAKMEKLEEAIK